LDKKVFWIDEVSTAWAVSGYTPSEVDRAIAARRFIHPDALTRFQLDDAGHSARDVIRVLASSDAAHVPLYYLVLRSWRSAWGSSIVTMRLFSVLASLGALLCAYVLSLQLFSSGLAARLAVVLLALSPLHLFYAQEAREYSALTLVVLASSCLMLAALRRNSIAGWSIYALMALIGIYTSLLFAFVLAAHALYVVVTALRCRRRLAAFLSAAAPAVVGILPWIHDLSLQRNAVAEDLAWTATPETLRGYLITLSTTFGQLFFSAASSSKYERFSAGVLVMALALCSFWILARRGPRNAAIFLSLLCAAALLPLLVGDVISGGHRLTIARYGLSAYVGIELAIAYAASLALRHAQASIRATSFAALGVLLAAAVCSCIYDVGRPVALDSLRSSFAPDAALVINTARSPILLSSLYKHNDLDMSSLSHLLRAGVAIRFVGDDERFELPAACLHGVGGDLFVFNPSPRLLTTLQADGSHRLHLVTTPAQIPLFELSGRCGPTQGARAPLHGPGR
jgi:uncharacterized membrane protein